MQKFPLISIIVPVYNIEAYIEKCLISIIEQTYGNLEILVIDDGTTDSSGKICDRIAASDNRVKVFHKKNEGLVATRKFGLHIAKGAYIGFVDGDDYIDEHMYERLLKQLLEDGADFIHSKYVEECGEQISEKSAVSIRNITFDNQIEKIKFLEQYVLNDIKKEMVSPSIWSKLFKAEFIKECYEMVPDQQQYGEDWICLIRSILQAKKISFLNEAHYHYVVRNGSLSHGIGFKYLFNEIHLLHYLLDCISEYESTEALDKMMYCYVQHSLMNIVEKVIPERSHIQRFYWGDMQLLKGKRIILYGAGRVGSDYYAQICKYRDCEIVMWVDSNAQDIQYEYIKVHDVEAIKKCMFDYILIAINDEHEVEKIRNDLKRMGISQDKIVWSPPIRL